MATYQITLDEQTLQRRFTSDRQLAQLVERILNQVLEAQVGEQRQAGRYERTEQRQGYRTGYTPATHRLHTGYKPRALTTRVGTLALRVPQVREGGFSPELCARYQRSEQALVVTLMEMVVNGVSTRKVARITEDRCGHEFAKSTVSDLCKGLDALVAAWNERDLAGTRFPFLVVDALLIKVREDGRVRSCSAQIATGINADGYREILGLQLSRQRIGAELDRVLPLAEGPRTARGRSGRLGSPRGPDECGPGAVPRGELATVPDAPLREH